MDLSLQRGSSIFIRQSTPRCVLFMSSGHASISSCSVSNSPIVQTLVGYATDFVFGDVQLVAMFECVSEFAAAKSV
jgi:hypothetical protein